VEVQKPYVLVSFLDWLVFYFRVPPFNIDFFGMRLASKGDWMDWSLDIGHMIETALDVLLVPINAAIELAGGVADIWGKLWDIIDNVKDIIAYNVGLLSMRITREIGDIWDSFTGKFADVYDSLWGIIVEVSTIIPRALYMATQLIYDSTINTRAWLVGELLSLTNTILDPWRQVLNTVSLFVEDINDLFSDPEEWLYTKIDNMLDRFW